MRVLLTGAGGNFGQQFQRIADFELVPLCRGEWNLLDEKLQSIDVVVHAASDLRSVVSEEPAQLMDANLMITMRLIEAMRDQKIPRLVFLSSCAVYGDSVQTLEDSNCNPVSINGMSKQLNEEVIRIFCEKHHIKCEIYRIFNMYGGDDHFSVLNHLQQSTLDRRQFVLRNQGLAQRDFIHVSDVTRVIASLLKQEVPFTHINIGTGVATRISDLLALALEQYPNIRIIDENVEEPEYSRADITRLKSMLDVNFVNVEDFVGKGFVCPERER